MFSGVLCPGRQEYGTDAGGRLASLAEFRDRTGVSGSLFEEIEGVVLHSGEVMFDVANDGRRPFNVETYASTISVLGTKFNVSVDEASGEFSAALLRGSRQKLVCGPGWCPYLRAS